MKPHATTIGSHTHLSRIASNDELTVGAIRWYEVIVCRVTLLCMYVRVLAC
jgi:hypothetical protein